MKKILSGITALGWLAAGSLCAQEVLDMPVTRMVETKMSSYSSREQFSNDLSFVIGLPLGLGIEYDKMANSFFSVGVGAGSFATGHSLNVQTRYYPMITEFSPYLGAGMTYYYVNSSSNVLGGHIDAGVDYTFAHGWGLSLGGTYVRFFGMLLPAFISPIDISNKSDAATVQLGVHLRF